MAGKEVRLPAGNWECWAHGADGWTWQRLELASGSRGVLRFDGPGQRLRIVEGAVVHASGWPELELRRDGDEVLLRGAALAAPLVTWLGPEHASRVHGPRVVPGPPRGAAMSWPPEGAWNDETESYRLAEVGAEGARVYGLVRGGGGGFDVVAAAPERERTFVLPKRVDGDTWLLLVAPDWAPTAFSWSTTAPGGELVLRRGAQLVVEARSADGLPVADLAVDYVPAAGEAAAVATRTDALGRAAFGRVLAGGTLRVSDARFANQSIELDEVPREPVALVVSSGVKCRGAVAKAAEMTSEDDTLIIVTADHGHAMAFNGYCGRGSPINGLCYSVDDAGEKHLDDLELADDGLPYTALNYMNGVGSVLIKQDDGTYVGSRPEIKAEEALDPDYVQQALLPKSSETHSPVDVAIYARGPWAHLVDGTVEQSYIYHVMMHAANAE
jgi:hypothetical protein